ncbi:MAG: divergent polysaccharide deacetylase family protein [Phenylobacterium sp.]|uniref:divergent polysaccharide deacetylase family protein n=1 Tax=Phenylobacterium sp. TaxID=1871053 RepID=UPI0025D27234|nr:divergent polysaccharide deacetylase family protein [Phenylobacterium sp.]MBI1200702.1 divergent polysaccharide deacetylase family protein [Phenylobacterium sp.]
MANIALPPFKAPRINLGAVLKNPVAGLAGAGVLFAGAVVALAVLLGPGSGPTRLRIPLQGALSGAPAGWRESLKPPHGEAHTYHDVVRLSERPLDGRTAGKAARPPRPVYSGPGLAQAPIAGFYTPGPGGPLPIIAQDGRTPAEVYARPFKPNGRPKVALVIGGLGLNASATRRAIDTLRPEITLSFSVYAEGLQGWIDMARARGHEVLLETPMEPVDYPDDDPGPYTLMAAAQPPETVKRLEWILSRGTGYFGLTNYLGSRFMASDGAYNAFASSVRGRGLAFIDDGSAARRGGGMARATAERVIDDKLSGAAIDEQLGALEAGALQRGQALGSGFAYPVTLEKVAKWANEVETRGFQLAPASSMTRKR